MGDKNIVICDRDFRYANILMENIAERKELAIKVYACTSWDHVKEISGEKKIDILVIDEKYSREKRKSVQAGQTFVLTTGNCSDLEKEEKSIYKYQCVDTILSEMFETYFEHTKEGIMKHIKKEHMKLFAVYSPLHRAGKTRFAVALGKELAKREKVLYLNMEEYSGFGSLFERAESGNLGDVLYYTKQESSNLGLRLSMMVKTIDGLDYIPPMPVCLDLKEVTWEEWEMLLKEIAEQSVYETILLDIGESIQGLFEILHLCDRIYMPILEDHISKEKIEQYEANLIRMEKVELSEKTVQFVVPQNVNVYIKQLIREEKI